MTKVSSEDFAIAMKMYNKIREENPSTKLGPWLCDRFKLNSFELMTAPGASEAKAIFFKKYLDRGLTKRH